MSVLRVPRQTDLSQAYSQHSLHRSISQLIDRKSLMMEEGSWDNPLGQDSGLVRTGTGLCYISILKLQLKYITVITVLTTHYEGVFPLRSSCHLEGSEA